ncbi:mechanosensitive ion channel protein MscS [Longimonas halophila]|uniref:Mechanosensitive ion channel protein MscS n=2 Tax=Longimonas halophila TaxID=1469170 RepID=A0A2H3NWW7_9BACT|nr:mechanosensitive ion channel protein MscS [Longimonas halophila]
MNMDFWLPLAASAGRILVILVLAFLAIKAVDRLIDRWKRQVEDLPPLNPKRQRTYTLSSLISSTARYIVWPLAVIMVLSELNMDIGALLATAGIAGLAVGFGAQTLVRDVISGIFLLFDDTLHVGDSVRIGSDVGTVEEVNIRLIKVRKFDGELLMIPAGELRTFGNRSVTFSRIVVPVGLSYEQDIDSILPVMQRVADAWVAEQDPEILVDEEASVQAINDFADSTVTARIIMRVKPGEQFEAERQLRLRLKREFDRLGIEIPFPRRTIYTRTEDDLPPPTIADDASSSDASVAEADGAD